MISQTGKPNAQASARSSLFLLFFGASLTFVPDLASAQEPTLPRDKGSFTFVLENDLFGKGGEDKNYTNGLKLAWMTEAGREPEWAKDLANILPTAAGHKDTRFEFEIGQSMYTPKNLRLSVPDPNDRPYAGLLYASMGIISFADKKTLDQVQLVAGVVGPASQAGKVHRWFHGSIDVPKAEGWQSQIPDQFAWELRLQRTNRNWTGGDSHGFAIDLSPHYGLSLGNLNTSVNAGLGFRGGWNLPIDFGPPRISPSLPGSGYFSTERDYGWYVFGGLDARYVAHSLVLDERSALGTSVQRQPWVADAQVGLALYWRDLRVSYTQIWRTREFEEQRQDYSDFGAVSFAWRH